MCLATSIRGVSNVSDQQFGFLLPSPFSFLGLFIVWVFLDCLLEVEQVVLLPSLGFGVCCLTQVNTKIKPDSAGS